MTITITRYIYQHLQQLIIISGYVSSSTADLFINMTGVCVLIQNVIKQMVKRYFKICLNNQSFLYWGKCFKHPELYIFWARSSLSFFQLKGFGHMIPQCTHNNMKYNHSMVEIGANPWVFKWDHKTVVLLTGLLFDYLYVCMWVVRMKGAVCSWQTV